jgi:hypothetical protein
MTSTHPRHSLCGMFLFCIATCHISLAADSSDPANLASIKTKADLDALVARSEGAQKRALEAHAKEILAAAALKPHVDYVVATLQKAPGRFEKINTTPSALKDALGSDSPLFDSLKLVDLANASLSVKGKLEVDPFDQTFYDHLGEITHLESLSILHTTARNDWLKPLGKLTSLKSLNIINQRELDDEGLAHLAGLKQLERFGYIGTRMTGRPFQDFKGWTNLKSCSFRGSSINDAGLQALCEAFPNLENISLAHAHFTDAAAVHLAKLTKLKGLEIASREATPKCLTHVVALPLEYLQTGDGLDTSAGIAIIPQMKTLKKLVLTGAKAITPADLQLVTGMKHLEHVEFGDFEITPERLPLLQEFAFLKSMRIVRNNPPNSDEMRNKLKEILPGVAIRFE